MIKLGEINKLKISRDSEYGFFLNANTGNKSDDILLPKKNITSNIGIGDEIEVFIYRDSHKRLVATQKMPKAQVGEIAILSVVENTDIGTFVDIGLERDVLVPFREKKYNLFVDEKYPFYIYIDKSGRLAATTDIEPYLKNVGEGWKDVLGQNISGYVFGFQTNKTALVCIEPDIFGIILRDEYYLSLKEGDKVENLKVIKVYEDGRLGLSTRGERLDEMDILEEKILSYIRGNDGYMRFNDKSDPEEIRIVFNSSKKNFKRTLGSMMKKGIIVQSEDGTRLK